MTPSTNNHQTTPTNNHRKTPHITTPSSMYLPATMSCQGHCNDGHVITCSCDVMCLVYRNCCEDFLSECPHVARAARSQLGELLDSADSNCSKENVFVLSGCLPGIVFDKQWDARYFWRNMQQRLEQLFNVFLAAEPVDLASETC